VKTSQKIKLNGERDFDPEDGISMFLGNIGMHLQDCMVPQYEEPQLKKPENLYDI
jgi:hypothetical protein